MYADIVTCSYVQCISRKQMRYRLLLHCVRSKSSHTTPNSTRYGMHRLRMPPDSVWMGRSDPLHPRLDL
jgi:hypothetical protein